MTKFSVTHELSALIKIMRMQNKISAKKLAEHVNKSPSFISKLENNEIKMIQEDDLTAVLNYIVEGEDFYNDKLPAILKTLSSLQNDVDINEQLWFIHYDTFQRKISIPEQMIDDINLRMQKLNMDAYMLAQKANANQEATISTAYPENELIDYVLQNKRFLLIRVSVGKEEVAALLQKKIKVTTYFFIYSLIFTFLRTEAYGEADLLVGQAEGILRNAHEYLDHYKVYSLAELNSVLTTNALEKQQNFLSIVSTTNAETVNKIINHFRLASEHDMLLTAQELEAFQKNLSWDQSFTMKLMGLSFAEIGGISFNFKKQMLDDIANLIEQYKKIPQHKKTIETY